MERSATSVDCLRGRGLPRSTQFTAKVVANQKAQVRPGDVADAVSICHVKQQNDRTAWLA
jgi:hypothetical protein